MGMPSLFRLTLQKPTKNGARQGKPSGTTSVKPKNAKTNLNDDARKSPREKRGGADTLEGEGLNPFFYPKFHIHSG